MDLELIQIRPFETSLGFNVLVFTFLMLLNILLSSTYLVNLSKRYPIKSGNCGEIRGGFIQALVATIPFFFQTSTYFVAPDSSIISVASKSILIVTGITFCFLSSKISKNITLENSISKYFVLIFLICAVSFISLYFKRIYTLAILIISTIGIAFLLRKSFSISIQPSNEPNSVEISRSFFVNLLKLLLFPFEIVLENIMIIPDSRKKSYSIKIPSKMFFSPFSVAMFSIYYFKKSDQMQWIVSATMLSMMVGFLMLLMFRRFQFINIFSIYSILISCIIQFFIFDQQIKIATSISKIIELDANNVMSILMVPLLSVSSICVQCGFIKTGFYKRSLISIYYFAVINTMMIISINYTAQTDIFSIDPKLKYTFGGIFSLLFLSIFDIFRLGECYTSRSWILPAYNMIQECVIGFSSLK